MNRLVYFVTIAGVFATAYNRIACCGCSGFVSSGEIKIKLIEWEFIPGEKIK